MKATIRNLLMKIASSAATLAILCAVFNVSSTCIFMSYQPDVPKELQ